jgi:peptidoglycan/LPS O-acetylase OafA/YrhL
MSTINYIKGFNGIRAISILFVLMEHLAVTSHLPKWVAKYNYAFSGITGVFIFFTLSGFLITTILLTEKMNKGRVDYKKFFIRRLVRLGPPLLVFVLMVSALMYFELVERNYTAVFLSLIYVNNFIPHTSSYNISILKHTWSLAVEQQFYILWPIIINNIRTFKRYLITIGVLICICIVVFRVVTAQGQERNFLQQFMTRAWFIPACMPIMIGCIAGLMVMYKKETIVLDVNYFYNSICFTDYNA